MKHIYSRIFDSYRILDADSRMVEDTFSRVAMWLDPPGCVFQRSNFEVPKDLRTDAIVKPGLYLSIMLQGTGEGGPTDGQERHRYGANQMVAMGIRAPTHCGSDTAGGSHMRAVGVAFPLSSLERLGLTEDFASLFKPTDGSVISMRLAAPPRIQALAAEMLSPTIDGPVGDMLLRAQATEILARSLFVLRHQVNFEPTVGHTRERLQAVKELLKSDLSYPWSIAELARRAGASRRTFNTRFRAAFGISASEYLRTLRLETAREVLIHQNLSVSEVAYQVGYTHPANFATAFKQHFGRAPSRFRDQKTP